MQLSIIARRCYAHDWVQALLVGVVFYAHGVLMLWTSARSGGVATVWTANAVALFALLTSSPRRRVYGFSIAATFAASVAMNYQFGFAWAISVINSLGNLTEILGIAWLLRRARLDRRSILTPRGMTQFAVIAGAGTLVSAFMAASPQFARGDVAVGPIRAWFMPDLLGMLVVVPFLLSLRIVLRERRRRAAAMTVMTIVRFAAPVVATGATAIVVFGGTLPVSWLCLIPCLMATFVGGRAGACMASAVVGLVAAIATSMGQGPFARTSIAAPEQLVLVQSYIAAHMLVTFAIAGALAERDRIAQRLVERERAFRLLAERSRRSARGAVRRSLHDVNTDAMTGIASRRRILGRIDHAIARAARGQGPVTLALFDIDRFKAVNDTHGHAHGDLVLQIVAALASGAAPGGAHVGRLGGEEFVFVFAGHDMATVDATLRRFRADLARQTPLRAGLRVTVSIGIAATTGEASASDLLGAADRAMYAAKHGGRDRVARAA